MRKRENQLSRLELKSFEGEFLYELINSYELSPKLSEQILISAKTSLLRTKKLREGQLVGVVVGIDEKSGKPVEKMKKKKIVLTINEGLEDNSNLKEFGRRGLRQIRIQRLTEEAIEQEGILSQEDLSYYLNCSQRTIKRDIQAIRKRGITVITRGVFHNVGRGQTHKADIIKLYLEDYTYSEIQRKTRHSVGAIKRYLESFSKVLMAKHFGLNDLSELSSVTGLSQYLLKQYIQIISDSSSNRVMSSNLSLLLEQSQYRMGLKKTITADGLRAEVSMGDCE
jgi:biotin operon repressor